MGAKPWGNQGLGSVSLRGQAGAGARLPPKKGAAKLGNTHSERQQPSALQAAHRDTEDSLLPATQRQGRRSGGAVPHRLRIGGEPSQRCQRVGASTQPSSAKLNLPACRTRRECRRRRSRERVI